MLLNTECSLINIDICLELVLLELNEINRFNILYVYLQSQTNINSSASERNLNEEIVSDEEAEEDGFGTGNLAKSHRLWPEIDSICNEQLRYARQGVGEGGNGWQLFAQEGEMKMYRREQEIDGMVVDPLKACHVVRGVTAREMCHYFFMPEYRNDWESKFIFS